SFCHHRREAFADTIASQTDSGGSHAATCRAESDSPAHTGGKINTTRSRANPVADAQAHGSGATAEAKANHHRRRPASERKTHPRSARHQTACGSNTSVHAKTKSLYFKRQSDGKNHGE